MNVIETSGLGKRYGDTWALRDCTLAVPAGHLTALVGPNGAGKTNLNRHLDLRYAQGRLAELGIPPRKKAAKLSGGQRAQLALTLALARRPQLLILDEPLAMLDPLARQDFMATVMTAMADDGVSVVLSSHALAEVERVADYLIVLSRGQLRVAGEVDSVLARHRVLTGPVAEADHYAEELSVISSRRAAAQAHLLVRTSGGDPGDPDSGPVPPGWEAHPVSLEELVMAYLRGSGDTELSSPSCPGRGCPAPVCPYSVLRLPG
jgi:ABC-2 type transport system ATP-binding protein